MNSCFEEITQMASFYSVVQYVPDAVREERVNIGVVVFGAGRVRSLFVQRFGRVRQFAGKDVSFLKDVAAEAKHWDEKTIRHLASHWTGSVQLTAPSASLLSTDDLLHDVARRYLVEQAAAERGYRVKSDAVRLVRRRVREKLVDRLGAAGRALLKDRDYPLRGEHMAYEFDISVGNGEPLFAAQGLSFEVPSARTLDKDISATAWLVEDVKRVNKDFPIGVVVLPPAEDNETFQKAKNIFQELRAEVVSEHDLSGWAEKMVNRIPALRK
jgi:hypothetical protein